MLSRPKTAPNKLSALEQSLFHSGIQYLAGVDEVGRGCLAGPVVAACIVLQRGQSFPAVTDSKLLNAKRREELAVQIKSQAVAWSVAGVEPAEIDDINIHRASLKAMQTAFEQLDCRSDYLLIDGRFPLDVSVSQCAIVQGDRRCQVIGAASIIAKVWRDRLMTAFETSYPGFQFGRHKGYGTKLHREELKLHGATAIHRKSFRGVLPSVV